MCVVHGGYILRISKHKSLFRLTALFICTCIQFDHSNSFPSAFLHAGASALGLPYAYHMGAAADLQVRPVCVSGGLYIRQRYNV